MTITVPPHSPLRSPPSFAAPDGPEAFVRRRLDADRVRFHPERVRDFLLHRGNMRRNFWRFRQHRGIDITTRAFFCAAMSQRDAKFQYC